MDNSNRGQKKCRSGGRGAQRRRRMARKMKLSQQNNMLEKKLHLINELASEESFKNSLILATVFQYFHYDVKKDLKSLNCNEFKLFVVQTGIKDKSLVNEVLRMLQDDDTLQSSEENSYQIELFNDFDLAVLGSSSDSYSTYTQNLQKEYATESYKKDRLKMLKTLLMIPNIYSTPRLRERFEDASSSSLRSPKIISRGLKKTLKRLKQKFPGRRSYSTPNPLTLTSSNLFQTSDQGPSNVGGRRTDLVNISVVRNLQTRLSTVSTVPSEELIWIRDESKNQFSENAVVTSNETIKSLPMDYEVEEGEIIDNDGVENLLQESLVAVRESQKINEATSSSTSFGFYEDRKAGSSGKVPVYETFGTSTNLNESAKSDDVIFVGDVIEETPKEDDSVIFVSEEKRFNEPKSESRGKDRKKKRLLKWKEKKDKEFEALNGPQKNGRSKSKQQKSPIKAPIPKLEQPTTSNVNLKENNQKEKRIVLIDGSNVAMSFTDNHGSIKTDADFSAEGLKICIEHFEKEGFQVKAIVPEFRVRFGKSSNYEIMKYLHEHGKLQCTASRAYDDRVLLEAAAKLDAAIVSNDYYRDLVDEKPEYLKIIKTRLIRYNWLFKELIITEDPYGRGGPLLKDILYKNS